MRKMESRLKKKFHCEIESGITINAMPPEKAASFYSGQNI